MDDTHPNQDRPTYGHPAGKIPKERIARSLSLLQAPDAIAQDLNDNAWLTPDDLRSLVQRVYRRHQSERILQRLPFAGERSFELLGPGEDVSSSGAVLLALSVGAGISPARIAESLGIDQDRAGLELYRARQTLGDSSTDACPHMHRLIGRYHDPELDRADIAALTNHSSACPDCGEALRAFRDVDQFLSEQTSSAPLIPAREASGMARLHRASPLIWAPALIIAVIAIAALSAIGFGAVTSSGPAPLAPAVQDDPHRGWLIVGTEHEVTAFDLESGDRRRIMDRPAYDWWNPAIVSPNAELVVRWEEFARNRDRVGALRAYDVSGSRQYLHRWTSRRSRTFAGWLDDRTVLFTEQGPVQRVGVTSEVPGDAEPSIVAVHLPSGNEENIYKGPVDRAVPAPDGNHLAVVRPARAGWPGKTVEILPVVDGHAGDPVASLEHRLLSWTGRIIWSPDSDRVFISAIHPDELPGDAGAVLDSAPGVYDFDRLQLAGLGVDGTLLEFEALSGDSGWTVPQRVSPDGESVAIAYNRSLDRDDEWQHGVIDLESGSVQLNDGVLPGARWWNTEAVWSPEGITRLTQRVDRNRFAEGSDDIAPNSLVLTHGEAAGQDVPVMVFQDTSSLNLRAGVGMSLLRWVPDDVMNPAQRQDRERPTAGIPSQLSQATSDQRLVAESTIASTGRYVLLQQQDQHSGSINRLMHLQAWSGTQSDAPGAGEFTWIPREPAVVGALRPDPENASASRLVFVATDQISPLHGMHIDPAGIDDQLERTYRKPKFSPNGSHLAFFVEDERSGALQLWLDLWNQPARPVSDWDDPHDTRIEPTTSFAWLSDRRFAFSRATEWNDAYPSRFGLYRGDISTEGDVEIELVHTFQARGRDRGIDLSELVIGPELSRIALRIRSYSGSDPDTDASDAIVIASLADLSQRIEVIRSSPGEGMTWLGGDDWLLAGIDGRIALVDNRGESVQYVTPAPSAWPVQVRSNEIWYQDQSEDSSIMRLTFE